MAEWEQPRVTLQECGAVYAPVVESQIAGNAFVEVDGVVVGTVRLLYGSTIERQKDNEVPFLKRLFGGE